jgi:YegS/Rv2252/BmrU family lipid kinase
MPKHSVKLILNPNADLGRAWRAAADLRPVVEAYGGADWTGTVYPTHAVELARQAAEEGYELVVACGGDGTVHEVVNGLMQVPAERRPRLGVVPLGTGNDFAHNIGAPLQPAEALKRALSGSPRRIDIGLLEDNRGLREYWDNTLGAGFDATVTIRSRSLSALRGFIVYLLSVLWTIARNHDAARLSFRSEGEQWEEPALMLTLCNGPREGGGFVVAPQAQMNDGLLHYTLVRKVSRLMMLRLLPEFMRGTQANFSQVRLGTLTSMDVQSDRPLTIHADGEILAGFGVDVRQMKVSVLPGALEVAV